MSKNNSSLISATCLDSVWDFSEQYTTDQHNAVIINELAARKFGWKNPIGKTIQYGVGNDKYTTGTVIGVVKDFHLSSMHRVIEPLFISNHSHNLNHILVRVRPEHVSATLNFIREK